MWQPNTVTNETCPLRRVVLVVLNCCWRNETLECGHVVPDYSTRPLPKRRRCIQCRDAKQPENRPMYRYRLSSTGGSSAKYGPCEVCGQHATEVFQQTEEQAYEEGWTQHECQRLFGHEDCLLAKRR
jgi:hypothetical protein